MATNLKKSSKTRNFCKACDSPTLIKGTRSQCSQLQAENQRDDFSDGAHPAILSHLFRAEEEEGGEHRWQELIDRARARANGQKNRRAINGLDGDKRDLDDIDHDFVDEGYELREGVMIWEIGCKVRSKNIFSISHTHKAYRWVRKMQWYPIS